MEYVSDKKYYVYSLNFRYAPHTNPTFRLVMVLLQSVRLHDGIIRILL